MTDPAHACAVLQNFLQTRKIWQSHLLFHNVLDADIAIQACPAPPSWCCTRT